MTDEFEGIFVPTYKSRVRAVKLREFNSDFVKSWIGSIFGKDAKFEIIDYPKNRLNFMIISESFDNPHYFTVNRNDWVVITSEKDLIILTDEYFSALYNKCHVSSLRSDGD